MADPLKLKEEGNKFFNEGNLEKALSCYTEALKISNPSDINTSILYKNRAAVYLKLKQYDNVVNDCTAALDLNANDPKSYYRRCQAHEELQHYDEAYKDAQKVLFLDTKNQAIQPILGRLHKIIEEKLHLSTNNRIKEMFDLSFGENPDKEKRLISVNNLVVLARERGASEQMLKEGVLEKLAKLSKVEKDPEVLIACIRAISEVCRNDISRCKTALKVVGINHLVECLNNKNDGVVSSVQYCIQLLINTLSGMSIKEGEKSNKKLVKENDQELDLIMSTLICSCTSRVLCGAARDAMLELIMRNVEYEALDWGERLLQLNGIARLMEIATEVKGQKYESGMDVTDDTQAILAVALSKIYDSMSCDASRDKYKNQVDVVIKDMLKGFEIENKVRATAAITTLLTGPVDVGSSCLGQQGILEMMLIMAGTDDSLQQMVAAEAIIAAATKKDKCNSIISMGVDILKKLFKSSSDEIRVRALVGLCKIGSVGGHDASIQPFADGSHDKLAEACRRFLLNPAKDRNIRKWSVEGLSYLTLNADIKEVLVKDKASMMALLELAKTGGESVVYSVVTTLVNLTNCYDTEEVIPEMIELAKFAKQHIPEEHPCDTKEFVEDRIHMLAELGVGSALVALSKTDSKNCRELICRVFNAICEFKEHRGLIVQQGGAKVLIPLALDGTNKGKIMAAQALARIGITINPEVAFPGQRSCEVVRPLLELLNTECSGLQNFEALMAICNLAQVSPAVRARIVKQSGIPKIENCMFEDHDMIRRAATQCMVNLMASNEVVELHEFENDKVKYLTLLSLCDDVETALAAGGALAIVTGASKIACERVFTAKDWLNILRKMIANEIVGIQHRGVCVVRNMIESSKHVAEKIIDTDIMELLLALTIMDDPERAKACELAKEALQAAEKWKLIQKTDEVNLDGDVD